MEFKVYLCKDKFRLHSSSLFLSKIFDQRVNTEVFEEFLKF